MSQQHQHEYHEEVKVEFPYDLNSLFSLTYSFDILKQSIEYLAKTQAAHSKMLSHLNNGSGTNGHIYDHPENPTEIRSNNDNQQLAIERSASPSQTQSTDNLSKDNSKLVRDHENILKNLRQEVNLLKDKTDNLDKNLSSTNKNLDTYKVNTDQILKDIQDKLRDHDTQLTEAQNTILLLKSFGAATKADGSGGDNSQGLLDALQIMVENLRKECYSKFAPRDDSLNMRKKIEEINEHLRELDEKSNNNENSIKQCRDITDQNHIDIDDLKRNYKNFNSQSGQSLNAGSDNNSNNRHGELIDDILKRLKNLENEMKNKLDCDIFDNEMAGIRAMIGNLEDDDKKTKIIKQVAPSSSGNNLSSKDINKLKEMIERLPQIEETLSKVLKDMKSLNISQLRESIESIIKQLVLFTTKDDLANFEALLKELQQKSEKHSKDITQLFDLINSLKNQQPVAPPPQPPTNQNEILLIRSRIEYVENSQSQLKKFYTEMKKSVEEFMENGGNGKSGGVSDKQLQELDEELNGLRDEFHKFRDDTKINIKNFIDQLDRKADKNDLLEFESRVMEKINEMLKKLLAQFADKNDTKKRLANLEKNVKSLFELLMAKGSPGRNPNEEDAMFTKKPLGGLSCASCERNITNLSGVMADYQPWKKLPFRENERIARYGPGFSKMLSMLKPEQHTEQSRIESFQHRKSTIEQQDHNQQNLNISGIQDHQITVEMPSGLSGKTSARTGYHFYKNSANVVSGKNSVSRTFGIQEEASPIRFNNINNSSEALPNLNIKVMTLLSLNQTLQRGSQ